MKFVLTQQQQMIKDSAAAFLRDISTSRAVREAMATTQGYDIGIWQRICNEMCWQAMIIPQQYDGLELGYVELAVVLEQMGRYLLCSPFFATVCLGVNALLVAGTEQQKQMYLPRICQGKLTATLAYTSRTSDYRSDQWGAAAVQVYYKKRGNDYLLNGTLNYVPDGHSADLLIVAARIAGSSDTDGISLFAIAADTQGISRHLLPTLDQTRRQATIRLDNVCVSEEAVMACEERSWLLLKKIRSLALIAVATEQMGGAQQVLDITVDYTKQREQFGRPIATFQAVKHRAADMMLRCEASRSAVLYGACIAEDTLHARRSAYELDEAASTAKAYCSDAFFANASEAIQLHGGVGFTWDIDMHLYFKRAKALQTFFGDSIYHREKIAQLLFDADACSRC